MSDYFAWSEPTAKKAHHCYLCRRAILKGEQYRRCAALTEATANTFKYCEHCYRISAAWARQSCEYEWDEDCTIEWLEDEYPVQYASYQAQWRYPDGELMPFPFTKHCGCGRQIGFDNIWCYSCDVERIERIERQLADIREGFAA